MRATSISPGFDARRLAGEFALGFLYWLAFVLVLEPGNLMRWAPMDAPAWGREILRLAGAGLLGAAATPMIVAMNRRFPITGAAARRRGALHLGFILGETLLMITASCLLARLLPHHMRQPLVQEVGVELAANGLLVAAWIAGLTALIHALRPANPAPASGPAVRQRGRFTRLDLADVTWIETQGNYLALHGAGGVRLVRATAKALQADLDPARFVRIHRRAIVALDAVAQVTPRAAGDADVRLKSGEVLRVSRNRRAGLHEALAVEAP